MNIEVWEEYTENEFERKFHEEKYIKLSNDINFIYIHRYIIMI